MKVMHLESGNRFYGGAKQVLELISGLKEKKIDNYLLCRPRSIIKRKAQELNKKVNIIEMPMAGDIDIFFFKRLKKILKFYSPQILHVHSRRGVDYYSGWCAKSLGIKSVLTRRVDSSEIKELAKFKYSPYDRVIAISKSIQEHLIDNIGLSSSCVDYVPSGVSFDSLLEDNKDDSLKDIFNLPKDTTFIIGIISQLIKRKGHIDIFHSLSKLINLHPKVQIICFGDGRLRKKILSRIKKLNLEKNVHLVGFRSDMIKLIPKLDLVIHPAKKEGLGLSILESLSLGVPVVAFSVGGVKDVVLDRVNGILVPPFDKIKFINSIDELISIPSLRFFLANNSRDSIKEKFSVNTMIKGNLEIYNKIMRDS